MKYCDGCGDPAVVTCPYCGADSCRDCRNCDHDARPPGTAPTQMSGTAEAGHSGVTVEAKP